MVKEEFYNKILELCNEYFEENGKWPNELHLGESWHNIFNKIYMKWESKQKPDIYIKRKHWWFMDLRVFKETFSHYVIWTKETAKLMKKLKKQDPKTAPAPHCFAGEAKRWGRRGGREIRQ